MMTLKPIHSLLICSLLALWLTTAAQAQAQSGPGLALEERIWAGECEASERPSGPLASSDCYQPQRPRAEEAQAYEVGPFPVMDLSPWFPQGHAYHEARKKVEGRDCAGALKLLEPALQACGQSCPGEDALRLLRGQAALCAGQPAVALEVAQGLTQRGYPGMEPEVRELLRGAQRRLKLPQAPELPPSLIYGAVSYFRDQSALARLEARAGDLEQARERLQALQGLARDRWQVRRATALEGRLLEDAGMLEDAGQLYYRVWSRDPGSRLGRQMAARLEDLSGKGVTRYTLDLREQLDALMPRLARAKKRERREAARRFAARHKLSKPDRDALEGLALGLYLERQREREGALKALDRAARQVRDPALRARIDFTRGTALRRLDRDA
jgi:tetratricopeptide (TPR) repeat protein